MSGNYCRAHTRAYQRYPVKWLVDHPKQKGLYVFMDTGSGKTRTAANLMLGLLQTQAVDNVVVLTPVKLIKNFRRGIRECAEEALPSGIVQITSFESMHKLQNLVIDQRTLVIVDEAHNLRNKNTTKYSMAQDITRRAGKVVLMSATPMMTGTTDLIHQINLILSPSEKPLSVIKSYTPKNLFRRLRHKIAFFTLEGSVYNTKPDVKIYKILVPMSPEQETRIETSLQEIGIESPEDLYATLNNEPMSDEKNNSYSNAFLNKVRRFANAASATDCSHKVREAVRLISTNKGSSMLFSFWIQMGVKLVKRCIEEKRPGFAKHVSLITGSTSKKEVERTISDFNSGKGKTKAILFSSAASEGLSTKNVSRFVVLEPQWQRLAEWQAIGRAVRINSHLESESKTVEVYYLMSHSDIDPTLNVDETLFEYNRKKYAETLEYLEILKMASIPMSEDDVVNAVFEEKELEQALERGLVESVETRRVGKFRTKNIFQKIYEKFWGGGKKKKKKKRK